MQVKYAYLDREYKFFEDEIDLSIKNCLRSGAFILRADVDEFESKISNIHGGLSCIGVNSGTDALNIIMKFSDLPRGSSVIVSAHTFVSSVTAIINAGLIPLFCDINEEGNIGVDQIRAVLNESVRGILVTHMNGLMADMSSISSYANDNNLKVFEDAAQAIGSSEHGSFPGEKSTAAAFSLHPLKTLSVAGDGGFIVTNDLNLAYHARAYRNLGQYSKGNYEIEGINSRLDNIQAAIANVKLKKLNHLIKERRRHAKLYCNQLATLKGLTLPKIPLNHEYLHTFSNFVINANQRDDLKDWLLKNGVEVMVHWDPPVSSLKIFKGYINTDNLANVVKYNNTCLSLPISPWMGDEERDFVVKKLMEFYK